MIKLVGSLCVLFAGGSVWWLQHQEQRRRRQVLAELAAALDGMETSISGMKGQINILVQHHLENSKV